MASLSHAFPIQFVAAIFPMAKKRKSAPRRGGEESEQAPKQKPVTFSPFADLKKMLAEKSREVVKQAPPPPRVRPAANSSSLATKPEPVDEDAVLREAYAGVRRFDDGAGNHRMPVVPTITRAVVSEEAEVLAALSDL